MKKLFAPLLLALAVLFAGGCANVAEISTLGLEAEMVKLHRTADGEVRVTWRIRNPNIVSYVFTKNQLKVSIDGAPVGLINDPTRFGVPTMKQHDITVVLTPNGPAATDIINRAIAKGSASYSLEATIWMLVVDEKAEKFVLTASGTIPATAD